MSRRQQTAMAVAVAVAVGMLASERRDVFVGWSAELDRLHGTLAAVRSGDSRTVLIEGPPGIGKAALIE